MYKNYYEQAKEDLDNEVHEVVEEKGEDDDELRRMLGFDAVSFDEQKITKLDTAWSQWVVDSGDVIFRGDPLSVMDGFYETVACEDVIETRQPLQLATPLEECLAQTIGLVNLNAAYKGEMMNHDFRFTSDVSSLVFQGMDVLEIDFPPAKLELLPSSVAENMCRNVDGERVVATGTGRHYFMGAIACQGEPSVVFSITTERGTTFVYLTRTSAEIMPKLADRCVEWHIGDTLIFSQDTREKWSDGLEYGASGVLMVDGNYWWAPAQRRFPVLVQQNRLVDRNGKDFGVAVDELDGVYFIDLDDDEYRCRAARSPVSYEMYRAWLKYYPPHAWLVPYDHKRQTCFVSDEIVSTTISRFEAKPWHMSFQMASAIHKPKGMMIYEYLKQGKQCGRHHEADVLRFYAWSLQHGKQWSAMDFVYNSSSIRRMLAGFVVRVPRSIAEQLLLMKIAEKAPEPFARGDVVWMRGTERVIEVLSCFMKPGVQVQILAVSRIPVAGIVQYATEQRVHDRTQCKWLLAKKLSSSHQDE